MQSRLLLNLFLACVVAALAVYLYLNHKSQQETEAAFQASTLLTQLNADDINRIDITHNQRHIELVKENDNWRMLQPISIDANAFRIGTLLKMLYAASQADYKTTELDLARYGLDKAVTSIRFNDTEIIFGITNPINNYRYLRVGDRVFLAEDSFYPLLSSQTGTLVAREPVPASANIIKLVLPEHTLYKDETGRWYSTSDIGPDEINEVLHNWKHTQAFGVHNYNPRESLGRIEVYLADTEEPIRFEITDTAPWLILARPELDIEYHFDLEHFDALLRPGMPSKPDTEDSDTAG